MVTGKKGLPLGRNRYAALNLASASIFVLFSITSNVQSQTIIDGEGFEDPPYTTTFDGDGKLEGQLALTPPGSAQWEASRGTTSTAIVQTAVALSGSQAVRVDRAANELPGGGRFGPSVSGLPSERFVCIEWDMWVEDSGGPAGSFGPFFGVEAYDDGVGLSNGRIGSVGVDATTGELLYTATGTGFFTPIDDGVGSTVRVNFGEWNHFHLDLDFQTHEYTIFLNDPTLANPLVTEPFEQGAGLDEFTEAPITAVAAGGDPTSQALTGVAYFDNYIVYQVATKIPEPLTLLLALAVFFAAPGALSRRRR